MIDILVNLEYTENVAQGVVVVLIVVTWTIIKYKKWHSLNNI